MDYGIDEYKVTGKNFYIKGWVHLDKYKMIIKSGDEEKEFDTHESRYDICKHFHEKIDDNNYGFKYETTFKSNINIVEVYVKTKNKKELIYKVDNRKAILFLKKCKHGLGKVKRGVKFLWREYHFLVPPTMMKKYIKMVFNKEPKQTLYNPEITSEYNTWLNNQNYVSKKSDIINDITLLGDEVTLKEKIKSADEISKVDTKYTLLANSKIDIPDYFFNELGELNDEDIIYFDNDFVINGKYSNPSFKPDYSRDTILGVNYVGHMILIKANLLKKINTKDIYKIMLYTIGKKLNIKHISKIMYHDYKEIENNYDTLKEYIKNNKIDAKIVKNPDKITNTVIYNVKDEPLISIIIPTKDHVDILKRCLDSIFEKTTYKNYEVILIDNNSEEQETFDLIKEYQKKYTNFKSKRIECEFNYSYLNNEAVKIAKGEYLVLLNNDTEVVTPEWLDIMLGYAQKKHIGVVGAKLLFPDDTIQHIGIIMGKGGLAGHAHYGAKKDLITNGYELKIPYDVSACTAACIMIKKSKYLEVGGLEEELKVAFNDVDFNMKILFKGYNNIILPNVVLYHYESKSRGLDTSPEKQKRFVQEWAFVENKWKKYIDYDPYYNANYSKNDDYMLK